MASSSAYLLVSHGSRDPRPQIQVEQLARLLVPRLQRFDMTSSPAVVALGRGDCLTDQAIAPQSTAHVHPVPARVAPLTPPPLLGTAVLECHPLPLSEQILQFAQQALARGCCQLGIVPLFLLPGVHVLEDIPAEVAIARTQLNFSLDCKIYPYVGSHPNLADLLRRPDGSPRGEPSTAWILVSHGSRRPGGNAPVEAIARTINAHPAYWSIAPSLEDRILELEAQGYRDITIVPYFLFPGGITDAIAQSLGAIAQRYPHLSLHSTAPLGTTEALADLVADLIID